MRSTVVTALSDGLELNQGNDAVAAALSADQPTSPPREWTAAACSVIVLLLPLLWLATHRLALSGMDEESTGYRYFYTLRILYGAHERPWLPQGQLIGIAHMGIQLMLTALGLSPRSLEPRIELFAYLAAALPVVLTLPALAWGLQPIRQYSQRVLAAVAFICLAYEPRAGYGVWMLTTPDYTAWAAPVAVVAMGALLRHGSEPGPTARSQFADVGIFAGVCFAIKPTYVIFSLPLIVSRVLPVSRRWLKSLLLLASVLATAALTVVCITWLYYAGDLLATGQYFTRLADFAKTVGNPNGPVEWLRSTLSHPLDAVTVCLALPLLFAGSLALPPRSLTVGLLLGSCCSLYYGYKRFYPVTVVELDLYAFMAIVAWVFLVVAPAWRRTSLPSLRSSERLGTVVIVGIIALLAWRAADEMLAFYRTIVPSFEIATRQAQNVAGFQDSTAGITVFLIPDNYHRLTTVDTAIFKGGSDIGSSSWGDSPYVKGMFPLRWYFWGHTPSAASPVNLDRFNKLVFVSIPSMGGDKEALRQLQDVFGVTTRYFDCGFRADFGFNVAIGCRRTAWPPRHVPLTPSRLAVTSRSVGRALIIWNAVDGAASFEIQRLDPGGRDYRTIGIVPGSARGLLDTRVVNGAQYRWRIRACNRSGCSAYSPPATLAGSFIRSK